MKALSIHVETHRGPIDIDGFYSEPDLRRIAAHLWRLLNTDRIVDYSMDEWPLRVTAAEFEERMRQEIE